MNRRIAIFVLTVWCFALSVSLAGLIIYLTGYPELRTLGAKLAAIGGLLNAFGFGMIIYVTERKRDKDKGDK